MILARVSRALREVAGREGGREGEREGEGGKWREEGRNGWTDGNKSE